MDAETALMSRCQLLTIASVCLEGGEFRRYSFRWVHITLRTIDKGREYLVASTCNNKLGLHRLGHAEDRKSSAPRRDAPHRAVGVGRLTKQSGSRSAEAKTTQLNSTQLISVEQAA